MLYSLRWRIHEKEALCCSFFLMVFLSSLESKRYFCRCRLLLKNRERSTFSSWCSEALQKMQFSIMAIKRQNFFFRRNKKDFECVLTHDRVFLFRRIGVFLQTVYLKRYTSIKFGKYLISSSEEYFYMWDKPGELVTNFFAAYQNAKKQNKYR